MDILREMRNTKAPDATIARKAGVPIRAVEDWKKGFCENWLTSWKIQFAIQETMQWNTGPIAGGCHTLHSRNCSTRFASRQEVRRIFNDSGLAPNAAARRLGIKYAALLRAINVEKPGLSSINQTALDRLMIH